MSQENVEIIQRANAAFLRGDLDALERAYDPDIHWRDLQHAPDAPSDVRGIEAVKRIWADWLDAFPDLRADISEYIDAGETVICVVHWHGSGKGSGVPMDQHTVDSYEVRGGLITRATFGARSKDEALEAAGLSE
jgi:ketosteroid isomerase-like protein